MGARAVRTARVAAVGALALALAACSSTTAEPPAQSASGASGASGASSQPAASASAGAVPTPVAQTYEIPSEDVVALPADAIDRALEALPGIVESVMERTGVPGAAVGVVRGGELVFAEGYGVRRLGESEPVDAETVFQLASLSKPIGSTVVASQLSEGGLSWDTPISEILPDFALADPWVTEHLTVGDLYAHRSGLPHAAGDELEDIGYDRDYILEHLRLQPLDPFRSTYNYANFGMTAGAEAVAKAVGVDWETLSQQALYEPLGMTATSSRYDDFLTRENRASLHALVDGSFQPLYERDPDAQSPAGGVSSNVIDVGRWLSLLLGQGTLDGTKIADAAALLPAMTPEIVSGHPVVPGMRAGTYGFGFGTGTQASGRTTVSHSGAFSLGAGTNFQLVPALDLGIVALTNGSPVGAAESITAEFMDVVQFGKVTRDWVGDYTAAMAGYTAPAGDLADAQRPASPAEPGDLEQFTGEWANPYYGTAEVSLVDGALVVGLGPTHDYAVTLQPWDGDTFAFSPPGENAPAGSLSSATFAGSGGGQTMRLEFFDATGLGTWTR